MTNVVCEGWWEQVEYGRQPMHQLQLAFSNGAIEGSGWDIVGPFSLRGKMDEARIVLIKQYIDQHAVEYLGSYDGEGVMSGEWRIGYFGGKWLIRILGTTGPVDDNAIVDIGDGGA